jgi:hypothetical protein
MILHSEVIKVAFIPQGFCSVELLQLKEEVMGGHVADLTDVFAGPQTAPVVVRRAKSDFYARDSNTPPQNGKTSPRVGNKSEHMFRW